jgi:hypothetical protein
MLSNIEFLHHLSNFEKMKILNYWGNASTSPTVESSESVHKLQIESSRLYAYARTGFRLG